MANGLTMQDAELAFETIKAAYAADILPELQSRTAKQVYVFCNAEEFELYFQMTYITAFKKANAALIPNLIKSTQINGFVNAEADYDARRIFIPPHDGPKVGTLAHEAIHYFSHKAFYPQQYCVGGKWPDIVEGATEYLTRTASNAYATRTNYQGQFNRARSWVAAAPANLAAMKAALFQGVATSAIDF